MFQYLHTKNGKKCLKYIESLDIQISRNVNDADIETRPVKSNGLWCCALLPAVLITYTSLYRVSPLYSLVAYSSVGLLFYCVLFIVFMSVSCLVLKEHVYGGCIAPGLVSALLLYSILGQDLTFALIFSLPTVYLYSTLLRWSLTRYPKTFTLGEAMIVTQGIVLFIVMAVAKLICSSTEDTDEEMDFVSAIIFTALSTVGLLVTALYLLTDKQRNLQTLGYLVTAATVYALLMIHSILGMNCIFRVLNYVFMDQNRAQLFTFWLCLVLIAVFAILVRTQLAVKASTVTRKTFHVLASLVFLSGILYDVYFMMLAAGCGLGLLILVEALRKSNIEPISSALQSAFHVYSDEKDIGSFAMTPMYLYAGLAYPLLLVPQHKGCELELLSGVLATGVGDTAASWFGARYGFNKWNDSDKTLEGTTFNILSQLAAVHALELFDLLNAKNALIRAGIAAIISGLVEAKTAQVDNLILPLVTLLSFQLTWFLC